MTTPKKLPYPVLVLMVATFFGHKHAAAAVAPAYQLQSLSLQPGATGGELGRRFDLTLRDNFLVLDLDQDFLRPFRQRQPKENIASLDKFTGVGMLILAAVNFARGSSDPEVMARKDYLIAETIKTQSASGYIGSYMEEEGGVQLWTDYCFHEAAYLAYGLAEDYRYFRQQSSLDAARHLADYLMKYWPSRTPGNYFTTLGAAEAYLSLYDLTKDERYLRFSADEPMGRRHRIKPAPLATWQQDLHPPRPLSEEEMAAQSKRRWTVDTVHIYRALGTALMQLRLDRVEPRDNLLTMSHRIVDGMTRSDNAVMQVIGSVASKDEAWEETQAGRGKVAETCANVYEFWFLDELLRREGDIGYGDIMERDIYNAVFGAQDPNGRHICYFTPFSGKREFFERDSYCCPNNFRRGIAGLSDLIYYKSDTGITINLYNTSRLETTVGDNIQLQVRQETEYPSLDEVVIRVDPSKPARFDLSLRIPRWCQQPVISVNGDPFTAVPFGQGIHAINREWRSGDSVTLRLPMAPRWIQGRQSQSGKAALLCGPLVYGLNPALNPSVKDMDLRDIAIDPTSVSSRLVDNRIRPGGTSYRVKGWSPSRPLAQPADLDLLLTEFADTGNEETYFTMTDPSKTTRDELIVFEPEDRVAKLR